MFRKILLGWILCFIASTPAFAAYNPNGQEFGGDGSWGVRSVASNTTESAALHAQYSLLNVASGVNWTVHSGSVLKVNSNFTIPGTLTVNADVPAGAGINIVAGGHGTIGGSPGGGPCGGNQAIYTGAAGFASIVGGGGGGGGGGGCGGAGGHGGWNASAPAHDTSPGGASGGGALWNFRAMSGSGGGGGGLSVSDLGPWINNQVYTGGNGGKGGGGIAIMCGGTLTIPSGGSIVANGTAGQSGTSPPGNNGSGGGGGGSGGVLGLYATTAINHVGSIQALGANGGGGTGNFPAGGGGGAGGVVDMMAPSITGSGTIGLTPGAGGFGSLFAAVSGGSGLLIQTSAKPSLPTLIAHQNAMFAEIAMANLEVNGRYNPRFQKKADHCVKWSKKTNLSLCAAVLNPKAKDFDIAYHDLMLDRGDDLVTPTVTQLGVGDAVLSPAA